MFQGPPSLNEESVQVEPQKRPAGILPDSVRYKLFRLSEQNKQSLLKEAIGDKKKSEDEGRKLIERLDHFDQSLARDFGPRSEAVLNAPFKLLFEDGASIIGNPRTQVKSFIIISYSWHGETSDWEKATSARRLLAVAVPERAG